MYVPEEVQDFQEVRDVTPRAPEIDAFDTSPPVAGEITTSAKPPSKASLKRSGIFETLRDEVDACNSIDELEAWNKRRAAEIKALPADWYDALGDRFQVRREELLNPAPPIPEADEMDESFRAAVGPALSGGDAGDRGHGESKAA
jgi:hypothetical protein